MNLVLSCIETSFCRPAVWLHKDLNNILTGMTASEIAAGGSHTCAIRSDGKLVCWGSNGNGELGIGSDEDVGTSASHMGDNLTTVDLGTGSIFHFIKILKLSWTNLCCFQAKMHRRLLLEATRHVLLGRTDLSFAGVRTATDSLVPVQHQMWVPRRDKWETNWSPLM